MNHFSKVHLLTSAKFVYSESDFPDKLQLAAEESLYESTDLNGQDAQRHAIAQALLRQNKPVAAIAVLAQITDPAMIGGAKSFMETIRKKHPGPKPEGILLIVFIFPLSWVVICAGGLDTDV